MEREERNSTNMTVGVVLTVAVAILLLVAMIPAMMPAQEGGDGPETPHVTSYEISADKNTLTMKYNDTVIGTATTASGYVWDDTTPSYLRITQGGEIHFFANADSTMVEMSGSFPGGFIDSTCTSVDDFASFKLFEESRWPALSSYALSPTAPSGTPDIYTVIWEAFFVNSSYDPGFDPSHVGGGSDGPVDTNTVLIGAIISLLFISIALVAVRSFRA